MARVSPAALCASLLVTGTLAAQTTWLVDDDPGPGVDFVNIPADVAAAAPGDTILVETGDYVFADLVIDKPLSILGLSDAVKLLMSPAASGAPGITVQGIASGQAFAMRRVGLGGAFLGPAVTIQDCRGSVLLDTIGAIVTSQGPRISVQDARQVHLHRIAGGSWGSLFVYNSTLTLLDSEFDQFPNRALVCTDSDVTVDGCTFIQNSPWPIIEPVVISGGSARIARTTVTAAGNMSAIRVSNQATLFLDPSTALNTATGQPPVAGNGTTVPTELVALARQGVAATNQFELLGRINAMHATFVSLPSTASDSPLGDLWLSSIAGAQLLIDVGVFATREHTLPLPLSWLPTGTVLVFQSVAIDSQLTLSNGLFYVAP